MICLPPPCNTTGDTDLQLLNPDGGWRLLPLALLYTNDCPFEGWWGRGTGMSSVVFLRLCFCSFLFCSVGGALRQDVAY